MNSRIVYLDNATTSLKTKEFIENLCSSYEDFDWYSKKTEIWESLLIELSDWLQIPKENISLVPSSTYAINEIWEYLLEEKKGKAFSIYIQREDHISNISSLEYLNSFEINTHARLVYFSPKEIELIQPQSSDIVLITWVDNLGFNNFLSKNIESLKTKYPELVVVGDLTQYMPYLEMTQSISKLFDFYYFSVHKCFGPSGIGAIVSKTRDISNRINTRQNYSIDWRAVYTYFLLLKEIKKLSIKDKKNRERQLLNFWIENFPNHPKLSYFQQNTSLIFLVNFDSEYFHDFLYFLESKNIIFRAYDLCHNSSLIMKRQIRFSLSFLNSLNDLKILFSLIQQFFKLKLA